MTSRTHVALLLTAVLAGSAGCAARVRVYDAPHRDYHRWNDGEERAYRAYLAERHREYRAYRDLNRAEQDEYWQWRHDHERR
jgi:hypothetical protein